jgi:hypothetical protein
VRFWRGHSRAPLSIAGFISLPLFFCSLMASTLALEKPHKIEWMRAGHIVATWHDPTTATVAKIWLWGFVPVLVLVLIGAIAIRIPLGFYVSCVAGVVIAMAVVHRAGLWERHHTQRYPNGVDLIPAGIKYAASNKYAPDEWEHMARQTADSLSHWTIGVALASAVVMGGLWLRRRFFSRKPVPASTPLEGVHAPDATSPGLDAGA